MLFYLEVCRYCKYKTFCEEYGDGSCEALEVLDYLIEQGKITEEDIKEYREKLSEELRKHLEENSET